MISYDWSRFTQRINIHASVEKLYQAFSKRAGMESWFLRLCEYKHADGGLLDNKEGIKKGDEYKWLWHGHTDTTFETGKFLKANGKDELQFVFGNAGTVTIKIIDNGAESIIELTQENIPTDEKAKANWHVGCSTGWVFYLANLKSIMEGGIDLRNKNPELKNVLNS